MIMKILTDDIDFAQRYFPELDYFKLNPNQSNPDFRFLMYHFFEKNNIYYSEFKNAFWKQCIMVKEAKKSQYDILVELMGKNSIIDGNTICLTGISKNLHGFRNRPWKSELGNIHLSVYLKPNIKLENSTGVFLALAAVSTLNAIKGSGNFKVKPKIKWVNDIFFGSSKVAGVLAHTVQMKNEIKGIVLGIGINVISKPEVEPTRFVPSVTTINEQLKGEKITELITFNKLTSSLKNYYELILNGKSDEIIEEYQRNSMLIGRKVRIWSDPIGDEEPKIINEGTVTRINRNLELFIDNSNVPIINGRPEVLN